MRSGSRLLLQVGVRIAWRNHPKSTDLSHTQFPAVVFTNSWENIATVLLDEIGKETSASVDIE